MNCELLIRFAVNFNIHLSSKFTLPLHFLHSEQDSNLYHQFWRLRCCHYTIRVVFVDSSGLEPEQQESKSCVLTHYTMNHFLWIKTELNGSLLLFRQTCRPSTPLILFCASPQIRTGTLRGLKPFSLPIGIERHFVREEGLEPPKP